MKFSATAAIALVGAAHAAPQVVGGNDLSKFQELDFGAPQDVLVGQHMKAWFQLRIDKFQAPHSAFTEDAWMAYAAKTCLAMDNNMCYSFHTYLQNHPGAVDGTDLSWWVVDFYLNTAKTDDYYHSNDASVTHSRVFNSKAS